MLRRALVGKPIHNERAAGTVLSKGAALPVFASDALSSVAYAPDEIVLTLALAGSAAILLSPWVGLAVLAVLAVIITAYRQNVRAYPSGGADFEIASKNLGRPAGAAVGAALMVDYTLVVAVSMAAAAQYLAAAVPWLVGHQTVVAVTGIALVGLLNLRGLKFMGRASSVPTYAFVGVVLILVLVGFVQNVTGTLQRAPSADYDVVPAAGMDGGLMGLAGAMLVLRAFSSGAVALTGVETITHSVPFFRKPKALNAARTLAVLGALSAVLLLGVLYLTRRTGAVVVMDPARQLLIDGRAPEPDFYQVPILGQIAQAVAGADSVWFVILVLVTVGVLFMAANTAYSGFPVLASRLASAALLPRQLQSRGDRFAFTNGIILLSVVAAVFTIVFGANVNGLIQLYVVGAFFAFTLTQAGMVRHWARVRRTSTSQSPHRQIAGRWAVAVIALIACAAVFVVVLVTKFAQGAWLTIVAIALITVLMRAIGHHYRSVDTELEVHQNSGVRALPSRVHSIIVVTSVRKPVVHALTYARASRPSSLEAVVVDTDRARTEQIVKQWEALEIPVPVTVLASPYRDTVGPVVAHIRGIRRKSPRDLVIVYLPEYVVGRGWERFLHNQAIRPLRMRLHYERGVMIASVPWHLESVRELRLTENNE
ncbi:APC family permease [Kocuria marina subsp. indica]|uniref:Amino acid/polyamine/organocation transporter, APC superfamily n=2 Tax=Kocuria marina TaxID=223184 RepID=A0A1X7C3W8_9MICC|nr:DNA-binding protein [Kocuria indica]RLP59464.1 APC family permease [Kocuria indica]SME89121.1 amino acid/polyamine/organocation transporter, APC superfamily [Kocuria indica]